MNAVQEIKFRTWYVPPAVSIHSNATSTPKIPCKIPQAANVYKNGAKILEIISIILLNTPTFSVEVDPFSSLTSTNFKTCSYASLTWFPITTWNCPPASTVVITPLILLAVSLSTTE